MDSRPRFEIGSEAFPTFCISYILCSESGMIALAASSYADRGTGPDHILRREVGKAVPQRARPRHGVGFRRDRSRVVTIGS